MTHSRVGLVGDHAAEVKGIFGLSPLTQVEAGSLREAILASDLFSAPDGCHIVPRYEVGGLGRRISLSSGPSRPYQYR